MQGCLAKQTLPQRLAQLKMVNAKQFERLLNFRKQAAFQFYPLRRDLVMNPSAPR